MNYYNYGLGKGLADSNCKVDLYTCPETKEHSYESFNIHKIFNGVYGKDRKLTRLLRYFSALAKSLASTRKRNSKLCHIHLFQYGPLEFLTCLLSKASGLKLIATVHDVEAFAGSSSKCIQTAIFKLADELIVHNDFSKKELENSIKDINKHIKIATIPHGNYINFCNPQDKLYSRNKLGLPTDSKIILFFGQIKKVKGLDILIRSLPLILEREPQAKLLIAGKVWKDSFDSYSELIEELNLSQSILSRIEYIPDDEVDNYYSAADVIALPYKKIYQSGVLLMAMSYGAITVSPRLPPMEEIITDTVNGYLFSPGDHVDLAKKIVQSLKSDDQVRISKSALSKVTSDHDWKIIAEMHMQVYKRHV
ncbi:glycosyltransferase family 4 protein [Pseudomonas taiwanensis]|uniref:glycosyltransferase family 4 protein n=1 Tax=Pseudomonas taiwanensis TaxID=470150 RepID=UPI0021174DC6|nr:glycosyltransferase family 4 protein [Pseudomonas taiwanensis]